MKKKNYLTHPLEDKLMSRIEEIHDHCMILFTIAMDEDEQTDRVIEIEKDLKKILDALNTIRLE